MLASQASRCVAAGTAPARQSPRVRPPRPSRSRPRRWRAGGGDALPRAVPQPWGKRPDWRARRARRPSAGHGGGHRRPRSDREALQWQPARWSRPPGRRRARKAARPSSQRVLEAPVLDGGDLLGEHPGGVAGVAGRGCSQRRSGPPSARGRGREQGDLVEAGGAGAGRSPPQRRCRERLSRQARAW